MEVIMKKSQSGLEVGKDYGKIFGLDASKGQKFIYNGGISWTAIGINGEMTDDSQEATDDAKNHLFLMEA